MANSYNYYDRSEKAWNSLLREYMAAKERKRIQSQKTWMQLTEENQTKPRKYEYVYSDERREMIEKLWKTARELGEYFELNVSIWYEEADGYKAYIEMCGQIYIQGDARNNLKSCLGCTQRRRKPC